MQILNLSDGFRTTIKFDTHSVGFVTGMMYFIYTNSSNFCFSESISVNGTRLGGLTTGGTSGSIIILYFPPKYPLPSNKSEYLGIGQTSVSSDNYNTFCYRSFSNTLMKPHFSLPVYPIIA